MYGLALEAHQAIHAARGKVKIALMAAARKGNAPNEALHLTCLNYALAAAEITASEVVKATRATRDMKESGHVTPKTRARG